MAGLVIDGGAQSAARAEAESVAAHAARAAVDASARSRAAAEYCAAHLGWQTVHCTSGGAMRSIEDIQAEVQSAVLERLKG